ARRLPQAAAPVAQADRPGAPAAAHRACHLEAVNPAAARRACRLAALQADRKAVLPCRRRRAGDLPRAVWVRPPAPARARAAAATILVGARVAPAVPRAARRPGARKAAADRKSTRLNSSHVKI